MDAREKYPHIKHHCTCIAQPVCLRCYNVVMKLYLSSYRVPTPDELLGLFLKPPAGCRVAVIPNAKDYKPPEERKLKLDELKEDLAKLGLESDVVDLREFSDSETLYDALYPYDAVWVAGGNTFVLRYEMRRSGFDAAARKLQGAGIIYCGESAGAIVAGPTLRGSEIADNPEFAKEVIWEGLGLTDKIIAPHADSPDFSGYIENMKKLYEGTDEVVYLNDDQALAVNN